MVRPEPLRTLAVINRYDTDEAAAFVDRYSAAGEDLALRTYTSCLIGRDPALVLHGGGNTSVKTEVPDILGEPLRVLCVKGSGWDLATIEPAGLPAVELAPLLRLRPLESMTDEEMVNQLRIRLMQANAPTPSVETLLHAFLPHKFVDHTHADAILELTDQPDGEARTRELFSDEMAVLPWIMPGFPLAKAVADAVDANPGVIGVVLLKHGVFTFGETAKESYDRMIDVVGRAERAIDAGLEGRTTMLVPAGTAPSPSIALDRATEVLPVVRGALALGRGETASPAEPFQRFVGSFRCTDEILALASHDDAADLLALGPLTPDHVIRTKGPYLTLDAETAGDPASCRAAVADYAERYRQYFVAGCEAYGRPDLTMLDPHPRVVLIRGVGLVAFGGDRKAADIAADLAEHTVRSKARAQALGSYEALTPHEYFEMEYWSLEQAKLGKKVPARLAGRIAIVTGAAGAIGHGICQALLAAGAHVVATDVDRERLQSVVEGLAAAAGKRVASHACDITDPDAVRGLFDAAVRAYGGVDIVVPNAGIAHVSTIAEMDPERFRKVCEVNLDGTLLVLKEAARVFAAQGTGGDVVVQASKNVFAPGPSFGAYSASKAGAHQLGKIAAMEFAELGVRVNMVNADAVFGDDAVPSGLWAEVGPDRMKSRGLDPEGLRAYYRDRSLLKVTVTARAVGDAVVFFASGDTPTTGATLPVDGGVAGAFPR